MLQVLHPLIFRSHKNKDGKRRDSRDHHHQHWKRNNIKPKSSVKKGMMMKKYLQDKFKSLYHVLEGICDTEEMSRGLLDSEMKSVSLEREESRKDHYYHHHRKRGNLLNLHSMLFLSLSVESLSSCLSFGSNVEVSVTPITIFFSSTIIFISS
jgi:hypothetical protein